MGIGIEVDDTGFSIPASQLSTKAFMYQTGSPYYKSSSAFLFHSVRLFPAFLHFPAFRHLKN
jgi:hypothetical protein